ncbi:MAG: hypothetical protein K0R65_2077 [Crocinitomicaceae bacterium]|jgi:hypothetical protein|nr:hypothetical protein [Crocinitomicaceae bacterium]
MKKIILGAVVITTLFSHAQESPRIVKVLGSFDLGANEVTTLKDISEGCTFKTSPHEKGILCQDEILSAVKFENAEKFEILKPDLNSKIYAFINCSSKLTIENVGEMHNYLVRSAIEELKKFPDQNKAVVKASNRLYDEILYNTDVTHSELSVYLNKIDLPHMLKSNEAEKFHQKMNEELEESLKLLKNESDQLAQIMTHIALEIKVSNQSELAIFEGYIEAQRTKINSGEIPLSENLKNVANIVFNVAISSSNYWINEGDEDWNVDVHAIPKDDIYKIIQADLWGALRGAVTGAIGGAWAGGIGALPGALVGACINSSVSSIYKGIVIYIKLN